MKAMELNGQLLCEIDRFAEITVVRHKSVNAALFPHTHYYLDLTLVISGGMEVEIDGHRYELGEGDLSLAMDNQPHSRRQLGEVEFVNLCFLRSTYDEAVAYLKLDEQCRRILLTDYRPVRLNQMQLAAIREAIEQSGSFMSGDMLSARRYLRKMFLDMFFCYIEGKTSAAANAAPKWLRPYLEALNEPDNLQNGAKYLFDTVPYNRSYFCRKFKRATGMTVVEYVNEVRLRTAKNLLCCTNEPVTQICERLGFSSLSYFYAKFKKKYGVSPLRFRSDAQNGVRV